jgi:hypothetical protein
MGGRSVLHRLLGFRLAFFVIAFTMGAGGFAVRLGGFFMMCGGVQMGLDDWKGMLCGGHEILLGRD